jgi:hypothetical protein
MNDTYHGGISYESPRDMLTNKALGFIKCSRRAQTCYTCERAADLVNIMKYHVDKMWPNWHFFRCNFHTIGFILRIYNFGSI